LRVPAVDSEHEFFGSGAPLQQPAQSPCRSEENLADIRVSQYPQRVPGVRNGSTPDYLRLIDGILIII
jgi:hypothetical protein